MGIETTVPIMFRLYTAFPDPDPDPETAVAATISLATRSRSDVRVGRRRASAAAAASSGLKACPRSERAALLLSRRSWPICGNRQFLPSSDAIQVLRFSTSSPSGSIWNSLRVSVVAEHPLKSVTRTWVATTTASLSLPSSFAPISSASLSHSVNVTLYPLSSPNTRSRLTNSVLSVRRFTRFVVPTESTTPRMATAARWPMAAGREAIGRQATRAFIRLDSAAAVASGAKAISTPSLKSIS
mmetsp:Transcript_14017/g.24571  ORF Transcript_14017/g.24571 Transcript_14017/m.24571 type:complete len:242 (-) Transcript_14017:961-1686(-)